VGDLERWLLRNTQRNRSLKWHEVKETLSPDRPSTDAETEQAKRAIFGTN